MSVLLRPMSLVGLAAVALLPVAVHLLLPGSEKYYLHLLIQILLWSFIYTSWALMGRFGLTSLGHGAFTGIGAYATVLLWNYRRHHALDRHSGRHRDGHHRRHPGRLSLLPLPHRRPLLRAADAGADRVRAAVHRRPARLHRRLARHAAGPRYGDGISLYALQFEPNRTLAFYIAFALWVLGLYVWLKVDASMDRYALDAASQDEDAAASVGIDVTRERLKITALSSGMCALGGAIFAQYQMYIGPDTIAGLGLSLNMVFAAIAGGIWVLLGPTVGAVFTQVLAEGAARAHPGLGHAEEPARQLRAGARPADLRAAAGAVHHLYAERHPRHRAGLVARRRRSKQLVLLITRRRTSSRTARA